jgi:meiotically up-regulated gene 157 (Mug157) protein
MHSDTAGCTAVLQTYGYNIPVNMYAAASLEHALWLNERLWRSPRIAKQAAQLAADIHQGV